MYHDRACPSDGFGAGKMKRDDLFDFLAMNLYGAVYWRILLSTISGSSFVVRVLFFSYPATRGATLDDNDRTDSICSSAWFSAMIPLQSYIWSCTALHSFLIPRWLSLG
jgi:hypothetical protein